MEYKITTIYENPLTKKQIDSFKKYIEICKDECVSPLIFIHGISGSGKTRLFDNYLKKQIEKEISTKGFLMVDAADCVDLDILNKLIFSVRHRRLMMFPIVIISQQNITSKILCKQFASRYFAIHLERKKVKK